MDAELVSLLSQADRALGRLDGVATVLPNPNLFVSMYVRQEAVLSSQIEGTQSTLEDVLEFEIDAISGRHTRPHDVEEVVNYVNAMNYGLSRLKKLPLSNRLICELHGKLLKGVRGTERTPGEFRRSQNWIGPAGCTPLTATFVPPPVSDMRDAMGDLEQFLHDTTLPVLVQCGLVHAQFETIHPFLDGNGRIGRLLITFLLCEREILHRPLLYLSLYLKAHRAQYYDRLMAVRTDGDWEGWLKFFLKGVHGVSQSATETARQIAHLREEHRRRVSEQLGRSSGLAMRLLDALFQQPIISVAIAAEQVGISVAAANKLVAQLEDLELLKNVTGGRRNRIFRYEPYLAIFDAISLSTPPASITVDTPIRKASTQRTLSSKPRKARKG
jgi:Fic family protein